MAGYLKSASTYTGNFSSIQQISNCSSLTGVVDTPLKAVKVIPIYKQGHQDGRSNYRSITTLYMYTFYISKVLEIITCKYNCLYISKSQTSYFSFNMASNAVVSLINLQDIIYTATDNKELFWGCHN